MFLLMKKYEYYVNWGIIDFFAILQLFAKSAYAKSAIKLKIEHLLLSAEIFNLKALLCPVMHD